MPKSGYTILHWTLHKLKKVKIMQTANRLLFKRFFIAKFLTYILYKLQF